MSDYVSIYSSSAGKIKHGAIALPDQKPFFPFRLKPPAGTGIEYNNEKGYTFDGIVTEFNIEKAEVVSVTPTVGADIYMYVGGESAWEITLGGLAFTDCERGENGFRNILNFYKENCVTQTGLPCELIMGGGDTGGAVTYKAYLTAFRINSVKKVDGIYPFLFKFYAVLHSIG